MRWNGVVVFLLVTGVGCSNSDESDEINVGPRERTTAALVQFDSCQALETRMKENLGEEMRVELLRHLDPETWGRGIAVGAPELDDASAGDDAAGPEPREEGVDFSGTNNQEAGVDEADFVKTDGFHIYVLNGNRLEIFGTPEFGDLEPESSTEVEGYPGQMLLGEDRIAVFSTITPWNLPEDHPLRPYIGGREDGNWYYYGKNLTKITILDVSDTESPSLVRELYLEGWHQTARRVDSSVRTVSYSYREFYGLLYSPEYPDNYWQMDNDDERREALEPSVNDAIAKNDALIGDLELSDMVPLVLERRPSGEITTVAFTGEDCTNFSIADDGTSRGTTSIMTFDLVDVEKRFESDHIVSNWSHVYASTDTLVIAEPAQDWWWFWGNIDFDEAVNIHRFDIGDAGRTVYTGSGRAPGTIRDQFALSEYDDTIRVASTVGRWNRWWLPAEEQTPALNYVFVLAGDTQLDVIGQTPGLAAGEQIWSSRFVGDKAYLVTFRNIDPLFTIDLSDPRDPKVMGELKIAGVSTYIHPLDGDGHLLTIGIAGDDNGLFWGQTQLSLFDVSDFTAPALDDEMRLVPEPIEDGWVYASSEAQWEHKAFTYWAPENMLAIPLSTYRSGWQSTGYSYEYSTRLELIRVDLETESLSRYGSIDHSAFFNEDGDRWWTSRDVRRSIFMGDYIYAISNKGVTAHRTDTLELSASESLPGPGDEPYWWW
ncbi:MAG: beta-propeller domain-containing protein [Myxococcota bacterium]